MEVHVGATKAGSADRKGPQSRACSRGCGREQMPGVRACLFTTVLSSVSGTSEGGSALEMLDSRRCAMTGLLQASPAVVSTMNFLTGLV